MPNDGQEEVIEQLEKLNEETAKSHSLKRQFLVGVVYGVGFVVGSAIIASILIGLFTPLLSHVPIVQNFFNSGYRMLHPQQG